MSTKTNDAYKTTYHRDGTVTYWSVYLQQWQRVSAYELTNRHDGYADVAAGVTRRKSGKG